MEMSRRLLQQETESGVNRPRLDQVVVVEDQSDVSIPGVEVCDKLVDDDLVARIRTPQQTARGAARPESLRIKRRKHMPPEARRIVIGAIERDPGDGSLRARV